MRTIYYAWASGEIESMPGGDGRKAPEGSLPIAVGDAAVLGPIIGTLARHAHDGQTLLVPGVPEADPDTFEAVDALVAFQREVKKRLPQPATANQEV